MSFLRPQTPPYDALVWAQLPFQERARQACEAWAMQGYGAPLVIYLAYLVKVALYVGAWLLFCGFTPGLGGLSNIANWWLEPVAFQKAILWSMLFEGLGLGCGSGPLTGRYAPPIGGILYFARPGTTKLPVFPGLPILGGTRRSWLDVALYLGVVVGVLRALVSPTLDPNLVLSIVIALGVLALSDRTIFLACRAEHYFITLLCFVFAGNWIAGAKAVQLALWFWAGFSKLNHHFPAVVCVMTSNSPFTRMSWLRRAMYQHYPDDLRPSQLAVWAGHAGTALELGIPLLMLTSPHGATLVLGMALVLALHGFITSNIPMGVPIEWNFMVVYGAFALFWAHPDVSIFQLGNIPLACVLLAVLVGVPLLGNLVPSRVSFLLAMRYYAGNWACSSWLLRGESYRKLERLTTSAPWVPDQLARFYDERTAVGLMGRVFAFRLMHLHGRALPVLVPRAVERFEDYLLVDGEVIAGLALGWNFGDGHLHREQLLSAIQQQCAFEPGELRCIFVESQALGQPTMDYRIHDAKTGLLERGKLDVRALRQAQPWLPIQGAICESSSDSS